MGSCSWVFPLLGIASYGFALLFNYGAIAGKWFGDLDVGEVSDLYNVSITPAGWTFGIWGIIYTWQAIWLVYVSYLSFKSINSGKLYFPYSFWFTYCLSNVFNAIWIAVWVGEEVTAAAIVLLCIWLTLILSAYFAHQWLVYEIPFTLIQGNQNELDKYPQSLILSFQNDNDNVCCCNDEKKLLYAFVLNGIPLYATWTTVATCINISLVFKYEIDNPLSNNGSVAIGLTILILNILAYWFCDFIKFKNCLRFTYTPYFVLIWAFLGVLTKYPVSSGEDSSVVILILLIIASIATIGKVILGVKLINDDNNSMGKSLLQNEHNQNYGRTAV